LRRRPLKGGLLQIVLACGTLAAMVAIGGCGDDAVFTPLGTTQVTVKAVAGSVTQSMPINLVVQ